MSDYGGRKMTGENHDIRAVLSYSFMYDLFMRIMGVKKARSLFASKYIRAKKGDVILDIGCGTAETRNYLADVKYYGFDPNPRYIKAAQDKFCDTPGCTFFCADVEEAMIKALPKFDIVLAIGVLHHLDDKTAVLLAKLAKSALKEKGRLILVDTCFDIGQPHAARFLASIDRGQCVRDVEGYLKILYAVFSNVKFNIHHDLMRFPYTHIITECIAG
jgi:SAM-dependent methyltransferase